MRMTKPGRGWVTSRGKWTFWMIWINTRETMRTRRDSMCCLRLKLETKTGSCSLRGTKRFQLISRMLSWASSWRTILCQAKSNQTPRVIKRSQGFSVRKALSRARNRSNLSFKCLKTLSWKRSKWRRISVRYRTHSHSWLVKAIWIKISVRKQRVSIIECKLFELKYILENLYQL